MTCEVTQCLMDFKWMKSLHDKFRPKLAQLHIHYYDKAYTLCRLTTSLTLQRLPHPWCRGWPICDTGRPWEPSGGKQPKKYGEVSVALPVLYEIYIRYNILPLGKINMIVKDISFIIHTEDSWRRVLWLVFMIKGEDLLLVNYSLQ